MKTIVTTIVAIVLSATAANALTLKKGEVLASEGGVMAANETANGQAQLADKGFLVAAGNVYIDVAGETVSVSLDDLKGKSKDEVKEIIGDAAADQVTAETMEAAKAATEAALEADGITVIDTVEEAMNSGGLSVAIDSANEAVLAAAHQAAMDHVASQSGWFDLQDGNGPQCHTDC